MTLALDGTPINSAGTGNVSSYSVGALSTTFGNGFAFVCTLENANQVQSITGGGLNFTPRLVVTGASGKIELWGAPFISALSAVTVTVTLTGAGSFTSASFFAFTDNGLLMNFDAGGPQQNGTAVATMTTNETAILVHGSRFGASGAPTVAAPWTAICSGVTNSFLGVEYQVASVGTYSGAYNQGGINGSIIDALYEIPVLTTTGNTAGVQGKFRRNLTHSWNQY